MNERVSMFRKLFVIRAARVVVLAGLLGVGASTCSSDTPGPNGSSGMSCETDCDRQAAAGCERTPPTHAASCKSLCAMLRESTTAGCRDELEAQYACSLSKGSYTCASGLPVLTPTGACAAEGAVCARCRGKLCIPGL